MSWGRRKSVWLGAVVVALGLLEAGSAVVLREISEAYGIQFAPRGDLESLTGREIEEVQQAIGAGWEGPNRLSPTLGWTARLSYPPSDAGVPDPAGIRVSTTLAGSGRMTFEELDRQHHTNAAGMHSLREFAPDPPPGVTRVAVLGNGSTYGWRLPVSASWPEVLMRKHPAIEAPSFTAMCHSVDQQYLRYGEDVRRFHPHLVVLAFGTGQLEATVTTYLPWSDLTPWVDYGGLSKPSFALEGGKLVPRANPLPDPASLRRLLDQPAAVLAEIARQDPYRDAVYARGPLDAVHLVKLAKVVWSWRELRRLGVPQGLTSQLGAPTPGTQVYEISVRVLDRLAQEVDRDGGTLLFMSSPSLEEMERFSHGEAPAYAAVRDHLRSKGRQVLDLIDLMGKPAFAQAAAESQQSGYYTATMEELIADAIFDAIHARGLEHRP